MSLLSMLGFGSRRQTAAAGSHRKQSRRLRPAEKLEERRLMASDIHIGMTYLDPNDGTDVSGNTFMLHWIGGAPDTQLTQVVIDTDKLGDGLGMGDAFFHPSADAYGAFGWFPFTIVDSSGIDNVSWSLADNNTKLILNFSGFDAGEKLVFKIDVDEQGFLNPNAVAEGAEFEGSKLIATFAAPRHYDVTKETIFYDDYDSRFQGLGLDLPGNSWSPPLAQPAPVYTAGAALVLTQQPLPIRLEGTVYEDQNGNNQQDVGDQGIAGVTLALYELQGSSYVATGKTTTTDANGQYAFENVAPGTYRIVQTQPTGYFSVGATAGSVAGVVTGVVTTSDIISQIDVLGGDEGINYDFAEARPAELSGRVYHDANNNGVYDVGESGIAGVTLVVQSLSDPSLSYTVTSAADGTWVASGLMPGQYSVAETRPSGWLDGGVNVGTAGGAAQALDRAVTSVLLTSGQLGQEYNFGHLLPSTISGRIHADRDGDCVYDPDEVLVAGASVFLVNSDGVRIATTTTNAQGEYTFELLPPGEYSVEIEVPSGYYEKASHPGSVGGAKDGPLKITSITVASGTDATDYNFCVVEPTGISGYVYVDANQNGTRDSGESPIAGVTVQLLDASGNYTGTSTITDANGYYSFSGLRPGTYGVKELQPAGYFNGSASAGDQGGVVDSATDTISNVLLAPAILATNYNFGELLPASISGQVHADRNGDCIADPDEPLVAGATVYLLDAAGLRVASTQTDSQGRYQFTMLAPGEYGIELEVPANYFEAAAHPGSEGGNKSGKIKVVSIALTSGVTATDYDFCVHEPVTISGHVYEDKNMNCTFDSGEIGIAGVTLQLLDANGNFTGITVITDANGFYSFTGLRPGTYGIHEIQPANYFNGCVTVGSHGGVGNKDLDQITQITLTPAQNASGYNFGELPPGTISGYVFQDGPPIIAPPEVILDISAYRDGARDSGDTPLAGVTLYLATLSGDPVLDSQGQPVKTVTDANGFYQFTGLKPGEYYTIFQEQPSGYLNGLNTPGTTGGLVYQAGRTSLPTNLVSTMTDDAITRIYVGAGEVSYENNFAEVLIQAPPVDPPLPPPQLFVGFIPISPPPAPAAAPSFFLGAPQIVSLLPTAPPITNNINYFGGVGYMESFTWHLSVVNGGTPRGTPGPTGTLVRRVNSRADDQPFAKERLNEGTFHLLNANTGETKRVVFGKRYGRPVTGDFNGDGISSVGVYVDGQWYIDLNGNGIWDDGDLWAELGDIDDLPVTGDWDGDGKADVGIFGPSWSGDERALEKERGIPDSQNRARGVPKNIPPQPHEATSGVRNLRKTANGQLRSDVIDHVFRHGVAGDVPVTGDWNGDGIHTIGLFSGGEWWLDTDGDGKLSKSDKKVVYGQAGDLPVVGDFNGDGVTNIGVYRDGVWYVDTDRNFRLDQHDRAFEHGRAGDIPVVGDWDGDGRDDPGVYRPGEIATDFETTDVTPST